MPKAKKQNDGELTIGTEAAGAAQALKATGTTDSALEIMAKNVAALKGRILGVSIVNTDEEAAALGADGRKAVDADKALEKDRTDLTVPLNRILDLINAKFGILQRPLKEIARHARNVIGQYDERKRAAAEKARYRAQTQLDIEAAPDVATLALLMTCWELSEKAKTLDEWETRMLKRARERKTEITRAERKHERAVEKAEEKGETPPPAAAAPAPAMTAIAPQVGKHIGGTTGVSLRWKYEIIDEYLIPRKYLSVNTGALQRAVDDGVREIPGCKIEHKSQGKL